MAALLSQEHHARGSALADLKAMAKRAGWNMSGASAVSSHSAGAAVSVRSAYANGQTQGAKEDMSPAESPGRLATTWVDGVVKDGLLLISLYLWEGEGLTPRNMRLLYAAGDVVTRHGGPFLIGGDFQNTPQEVQHRMAK